MGIASTSKLRSTWPRLVSGAAILAVAVVAGLISYTHIENLSLALHQTMMVARLMPVGIDGLITDASIDAHRLERRGGCACGGCTCQPAEPMTSRPRPGCARPCWRWPPTQCPAPAAWRALAHPAAAGPVHRYKPAAGRGQEQGHSRPPSPRGHPARSALRMARRLRQAPRRLRMPPPHARSQGGKTSLGNLKLLCDYTITRCSSTASGGNSSPTQTAAWTPSGRRARLCAATDPRPLARANRLYGRPSRSNVRLRAR